MTFHPNLEFFPTIWSKNYWKFAFCRSVPFCATVPSKKCLENGFSFQCPVLPPCAILPRSSLHGNDRTRVRSTLSWRRYNFSEGCKDQESLDLWSTDTSIENRRAVCCFFFLFSSFCSIFSASLKEAVYWKMSKHKSLSNEHLSQLRTKKKRSSVQLVSKKIEATIVLFWFRKW